MLSPPPYFKLGPRASPSSTLLGTPLSRAVRGWDCWYLGAYTRQTHTHTHKRSEWGGQRRGGGSCPSPHPPACRAVISVCSGSRPHLPASLLGPLLGKGCQGRVPPEPGIFVSHEVRLHRMVQGTSTRTGGEEALGGGRWAGQLGGSALASLLQVHPLLPHPLHVLQRLLHSHQS